MSNKELKKRLKEGYSICSECAHQNEGVSMGTCTHWIGRCCICEEEKSCCAITDFNWPRELGIGYIWD